MGMGKTLQAISLMATHRVDGVLEEPCSDDKRRGVSAAAPAKQTMKLTMTRPPVREQGEGSGSSGQQVGGEEGCSNVAQ